MHEVTSCLYLGLLRASVQRRLQLADDGVSLSEDAAVSVSAVLLQPLDVPPGVTHLLQLQRLPAQQHLQALKHTTTNTETRRGGGVRVSGGGGVMCARSYCDGFLVVGQDAALPLQVSLLLSEQQSELATLLLLLLHAAELLVHRSLQVRREKEGLIFK